MIEAMRGCGYRTMGSTYIEGIGLARPCDRLPFKLEDCPVCGNGIKFSRGYQWISWLEFAGIHKGCSYPKRCPLCDPQPTALKYGLMWVGKKYYTPHSFVKEAMTFGISKKIAFIPKELEIGKTWILLAHQEADRILVPADEVPKKRRKKLTKDQTLDGMTELKVPAIFYAFRPSRVVKIITKKEAEDPKIVENLMKRGITPLVGEPDDKGNVTDTYELKDLGIVHKGGEKGGPDTDVDSADNAGGSAD